MFEHIQSNKVARMHLWAFQKGYFRKVKCGIRRDQSATLWASIPPDDKRWSGGGSFHKQIKSMYCNYNFANISNL
jgi:hypothetical protein